MTDNGDLEARSCGPRAARYLGDLVHHPGQGSRVVALADLIRELLARTSPRFPDVAMLAESHQPLLACGLDAVIITTPDHTHEEIIIDFLRRGVAVFAGEAAGHHHRGLRRRAAGRPRDRHPALRRAQHAPHAGGAPTDARAHRRRAPSARSRRSGAVTSSATAATTTSRTGTPTARNTTGLLLQKGAHDIDVIHWLAGGYTRA